jgi:hypothetical protein
MLCPTAAVAADIDEYAVGIAEHSSQATFVAHPALHKLYTSLQQQHVPA